MQEGARTRTPTKGRALAVPPTILGAAADGPRLSPRQRQVTDLLTRRGLSVKQAAAELGTSPATLNTYVGRLYRKLGIHSRGELFAWVWANTRQPTGARVPFARGARSNGATSEGED